MKNNKIVLKEIKNFDFFKKYTDLSKNIDWKESNIKKINYIKKSAIKKKIKSFFGFAEKRDETFIKKYYAQWSKRNFLTVNPEESTDFLPTKWNNKAYMMNGFVRRRFMLNQLINLIKIIKPQSILEVGCGYGFYPVLLSSVFPKVKISGIELTEEGIKSALALQKKSVLPMHWQRFVPHKIINQSAFKNINFIVGSAKKIPFKDNSFDLVFTSLALEQMESIRMKALKEIYRVTKNYVSFMEPFKDFNNSFPQKQYIFLMNYFKGSIADCENIGFKKLYLDSKSYPQVCHMNVAHFVGKK